MPKPIIRIEADHREASSGIIDQLASDPEVDLITAQLEIGDYRINEHAVIERKSADDFTASILDRRLFQQHEAAKDQGVGVIYLLEGDVYGTGRIHDNAIVGALSWLAAIEQVPIVPTGSPIQSVQMIKTIGRHMQHGLGYDVAQLRPPKPKKLCDQQVSLIHTLPGVGLAKAQALLEYWGSPQAVFQATEAELQAVPGIGKKLAANIRYVVTQAYRQT